ncbi:MULTISPECIES: DUF3147 family protein [Lysinibacillus]|uniref:DUF3147 family protein n=1 Tax=Lysinibacillus sphaericus TaxID=1421 RepID=A0A544UPV1_LYSSH|nr:DUF3147 family protein [Lysinibacillus sp. SDF0037]TQR35849.1 DUF3147 family protein [Lysinibacillus sp. SDF0037]
MYTFVKILCSAAVIGIVTEIARRFPSYGGIIAALPLVSILSIIWLTVQSESSEHIQRFTVGVIVGLPATMFMLFVIYMAMKSSIHIVFAIGLGIVSWAVFLGVQKAIASVFNFSI